MKVSLLTEQNKEELGFHLIFALVVIGSLFITIVLSYQFTPFWQCDSVYGGGFYARSCFNMAFTFFIWINGMIMGLGYFFLRMNKDKIVSILS